MQDQAEIYDNEYYRRLTVRSGRIETLLQFLHFDQSDEVCEIGCASGHLLAAIAPRIRTGVGLDPAVAAIRQAIDLKKTLELENVTFVQATAEAFANIQENIGRFAVVLLLDVSEHVDDNALDGIFRAALTLLNKSGRLVVHTPNLGYWLERLKASGLVPQVSGHIAVRTLPAYENLLQQAGFVVTQRLKLPHYRKPLRMFDLRLMRVPVLGGFFVARLLLTAQKIQPTPDQRAP